MALKFLQKLEIPFSVKNNYTSTKFVLFVKNLYRMNIEGFLGTLNLLKHINASVLLNNLSVLLDNPLVLLGSADSIQPPTAVSAQIIRISHVIRKIDLIFLAISRQNIGPKIMPKT